MMPGSKGWVRMSRHWSEVERRGGGVMSGLRPVLWFRRWMLQNESTGFLMSETHATNGGTYY